MKRYKVRKWFKFSEDIFIDADSEIEAKDRACSESGLRNYDDYLDSCEILETIEEDEQ